MPFTQRKSASQIAATQNARCQTRTHPNHAAKKAKNDCRPLKVDRRLDQNISLVDQRASLVAQQITEADSVIRLSLQEQISLLDARKAEDELLASKVPDLEVMIIDGNGNCFWSALSVFLDSAGLPPESPESIMKGTADVLRAVNTNDDQSKSPCYFSLSWCVRADLIWLGCLGTDEYDPKCSNDRCTSRHHARRFARQRAPHPDSGLVSS